MQLKNNREGNAQLHYSVVEGKKSSVDYIHIPGGATVEIEDAVFEQLCKPLTTVSVMERVVSPIESEVPVEMDKKPVMLTEFYETGETKRVNLLCAAIKRGDFTVVERVAVSPKVITQFLNSKGIAVADMAPEQQEELYNKLA